MSPEAIPLSKTDREKPARERRAQGPGSSLSPESMAARRAVATAIWRDMFAAKGVERSVLMASTFRSGSTFVASLLKQNGVPGLGKERFAESWRHIAPEPGEDFSAFLGAVLSEVSEGYFGTKLMWPHLAKLGQATGHGRTEARDFAALFGPAQWVQVCRADKFDQAISFWRAKASGRWHVYAKESEPQLDYDFAAIHAALREIELHDRLWDDFFDCAGITPIRVIYEEIEADPATKLAAVLASLGVPFEAPKTMVALKRQRDELSSTLRERFLADLYRV